MSRFEVLLSRYEGGNLSVRERTELAEFLDRDPECLDAFLEVVSAQRIRRMTLSRN